MIFFILIFHLDEILLSEWDFLFGWDSFIWTRFFILDEILLSEWDFLFGWDSFIWMRFFTWMIVFIWMRFSNLNEIFWMRFFYLGRDWSASLSRPTQRFHLVWDLWEVVSGRQTPPPLSGPTMDHPPSTLSSFINLLASRQKVFLILGRSVFFFFPYNISHPSPKVSGLSGSLVMLVLSRSVINDDCIPDRSGAFSQIIPSIPWIIKRMKKIIINTKI